MMFEKNGDYISKVVETGKGTARFPSHKAYRQLLIDSDKDKILNDNSESVKVSIRLIDGLEVCQGTAAENATVLDYNGSVVLFINGEMHTKELVNGSVSFDLVADSPSGFKISIFADSVFGYPTASGTTSVEVVSA